MTLSTLIRRAIVSWEAWRQRQALLRAVPVLRELDRLEAEYRRQHRRGSAKIARAKRQAIHLALAGGKPSVCVQAGRG